MSLPLARTQAYKQGDNGVLAGGFLVVEEEAGRFLVVEEEAGHFLVVKEEAGRFLVVEEEAGDVLVVDPFFVEGDITAMKLPITSLFLARPLSSACCCLA